MTTTEIRRLDSVEMHRRAHEYRSRVLAVALRRMWRRLTRARSRAGTGARDRLAAPRPQGVRFEVKPARG